MIFLTLSNANIQFIEKKLIWRYYIIAEALPTIKYIELINKKEFAKTVFDAESELFVLYLAALKIPLLGMTIHPSQIA